MNAATKDLRKRVVKLPAKAQSAELSHWQELRDAISNCPDDMLRFTPEIVEAVALIKHAGPQPRWLESLAVALRILVKETIKSAHDIQCFEQSLVTVCEHLNNHIESFGLVPSGGKWKRYEERPRPGVDSTVFPPHKNVVRIAKGGA